MLTDKSTFFSSISLSDKESMVLRSYALGMGDTAICKTLKLSRIQLNQIAQSLLDKFCVQNQYHLVKKAYRVGYLDRSNFILEDIKTKTLVQLKDGKNCYVVPRNNHHITVFKKPGGELTEEVVTFWTAVNRFRKEEPVYMQLKKDQGEVITHLHISDFFLLGLEKGVDVKTLPKETLFKHLYRVQKLSSRYYEFRSAHKQISNHFDYPDYIRINNFGDRKTGWKTYNPIKVKLSVTGKIQLE